MSYTKTPYNMTESEWERVEDYIAENDDIYYSIRDDMWFDVCDWLARDYNRNNEAFVCEAIAFDDSGEIISLGGFEINTNHRYFKYDSWEFYDNGYDIYVDIDTEKSNDNFGNSEYTDFDDNVVFNVTLSYDEDDGPVYAEDADFETYCTMNSIGRVKSEFIKRGLESAYNEVSEAMQAAIDELNSEFETFESEVIDNVSGWFTMRGPDFRNYTKSYQRFNVEFDDDGNVLDIEL